MKNVEDIKIYLLDIDSQVNLHWRLAFASEPNVEVVQGEFVDFMAQHNDVDCIVSPANAFGEMTGGYDAAISNYLGWDYQKNVQAYIKEHYRGEQPIATSFIIDTNKEGLKLIHTPTMRVPSLIKDQLIVYQCMRTTLLCALDNDVKCIVIPAFGACCGQVSPVSIAAMMKKAYIQIKTCSSVNQI